MKILAKTLVLGRLIKPFFCVIFLSKICVLCMFYVDWELGGVKKLSGRDFFEYKLVRVGLQETNNYF